MVKRVLPGIGLTGFWPQGDDNWKPEMDANLRALSALVQPRVLSIVAADPAAPVDGAVHFFDAAHPTNANKLAIRDDGAWVYVPAFEGMQFFNVADKKDYVFKAGAIAEASAGLNAEAVQDMIAGFLEQGTNITLTYNDAGDKLKIDATGGGGGGGGGGPVTVSSFGTIFDGVVRFRTTRKEIAQYGAGDIKAGVVMAGDLRALVCDYYGNAGTPQGRDLAKITVPAGKEAFLLYVACGNYVRTNGDFYRWRIYNDTAGTTVFNPAGITDTWEPSGWIMPDHALGLTDYPIRVGVAGQTISAGAFTAGDGNTRAISGFAIIALVDAATGDWSSAVSQSSGGGGSIVVSEQTANYAPALADAESLIRMNVAAANTVTLPSDATTAFPIGTRLNVSQAGAGQTSFAAGANATVNSRGAALKIAGQYGVATAIKVAANTWLLVGDLTA